MRELTRVDRAVASQNFQVGDKVEFTTRKYRRSQVLSGTISKKNHVRALVTTSNQLGPFTWSAPYTSLRKVV
jgi:hypothetical protein